MPQTQVRVVGSGFTVLRWRGKPISWLDNFQDSGQQPVGNGTGPGWEAITTIGDNHPVEIATSRVLGPGQITASIRELWNEPVWFQLEGLRGRRHLVSIWRAMADMGPVSCQMVIKPPNGAGPNRVKTYHGCVVTSIDNGERVEVGSLSVSKNIVITYTHFTTGDGNDNDDNGNNGGGNNNG